MPLDEAARNAPESRKRACAARNFRMLAEENRRRKPGERRTRAQIIAIVLDRCGMARKEAEIWVSSEKATTTWLNYHEVADLEEALSEKALESPSVPQRSPGRAGAAAVRRPPMLTGRTGTSGGHSHSVTVNLEGNGRTGTSSGHSHEVRVFQVMTARGHSHSLTNMRNVRRDAGGAQPNPLAEVLRRAPSEDGGT